MTKQEIAIIMSFLETKSNNSVWIMDTIKQIEEITKGQDIDILVTEKSMKIVSNKELLFAYE